MKAATGAFGLCPPPRGISIHAAREGGDESAPDGWQKKLEISIHAAREGGDEFSRNTPFEYDISIHAAREGGDDQVTMEYINPLIISIHAAREGGDNMLLEL